MLLKKQRIEDKKILEIVRRLPCAFCGEKPVDAAHIKTVKSGGDDVFNNVLPLCRRHHSMQHTVGFLKMYHLSKRFRDAIDQRGWIIDEVNGHRKLRRKDEE